MEVRAFTDFIQYAITIPKAAMESWVATILPRLFAFDSSDTQVGMVPVFIPLPIPLCV